MSGVDGSDAPIGVRVTVRASAKRPVIPKWTRSPMIIVVIKAISAFVAESGVDDERGVKGVGVPAGLLQLTLPGLLPVLRRLHLLPPSLLFPPQATPKSLHLQSFLSRSFPGVSRSLVTSAFDGIRR